MEKKKLTFFPDGSNNTLFVTDDGTELGFLDFSGSKGLTDA